MTTIKRALISVSDKTGIVEFAGQLQHLGVEILSTGGTARLLAENGIDVVEAIMESSPCPILVVTGVSPDDPELAYRAVKAGALEVTGKLPAPGAATAARSGGRSQRWKPAPAPTRATASSP